LSNDSGAFFWTPNSTISDPSLDHIVGAGEQHRRHGEAERPGGLGVENQLELSGLHDRQVRRLVPLEDATGIDADLIKNAWRR
jgi:hypothetical protein